MVLAIVDRNRGIVRVADQVGTPNMAMTLV